MTLPTIFLISSNSRYLIIGKNDKTISQNLTILFIFTHLKAYFDNKIHQKIQPFKNLFKFGAV